MPLPATVKLNTGAEMPLVGLGTWQSKPGEVEHAVEFALKHGYKHIDTAAAYKNEKEVGQGIKASGVPRESFFLTTKLDNPDQGREAEALEESLSNLGTSYLDLWLMHWPAPHTKDDPPKPNRDVQWIDTWKQMEKLYEAHPDKLKAIGVSNFSIKFLEILLKEAKITPAVNQIELHPACPQLELVEYCRQKGIIVTAYSPLGSAGSPLQKNPIVEKLAKKYDVQPANILVSLQANRPGVTVIPKSVTNDRIANNSKIVELTQEEIDELHTIDKTGHFRACHPNWTGYGSLGFPDCEE